eukprot:763615-Hanusia_phi.AAC.6
MGAGRLQLERDVPAQVSALCPETPECPTSLACGRLELGRRIALSEVSESDPLGSPCLCRLRLPR